MVDAKEMAARERGAAAVEVLIGDVRPVGSMSDRELLEANHAMLVELLELGQDVRGVLEVLQALGQHPMVAAFMPSPNGTGD